MKEKGGEQSHGEGEISERREFNHSNNMDGQMRKRGKKKRKWKLPTGAGPSDHGESA
jgi:hypothetical protein